MTHSDIIKLAQEAGLLVLLDEDCFQKMGTKNFDATKKVLGRFAALVAAHEREACAKVCEARYMGDNNREDMEARRCAAAIRARGQA
jgi:hypothetical protein